MATGRKTGGRTKGSGNKLKTEVKKVIAVTGQTPLEYMEEVMNNPKAETSRRDDMAKAAAPYRHPRLQATTIGGDKDNPLKVEIDDLELSRRLVLFFGMFKDVLTGKES